MTIKIIGRKYSDTATYGDWDTEKEFPTFAKVAEQTWEIEAETLDEAEGWLIENHPDMYMGASIICENGDFSCIAVPCSEYGEGNYETTATRIDFVRRML